MKSKFLLDACALIALLSDEAGAGTVNELVENAYYKNIELFMSKINLLEVYFSVRQELGIAAAEKVFTETMASPVQIIDTMDNDVFREAGRLKAAYKISFADSIALGYASVLGCSLVTADHQEFDAIESNEKIPFIWIR